MVRIGLGLAAALVVAASAVAAPPREGKVECIWKQLPEAYREELLTEEPSTRRGLKSRISTVSVPSGGKEIGDAAAACGVRGVQPFVEMSFLSRIPEERARRWLTVSRALSEERLEAEWLEVLKSMRHGRAAKAPDWARIVGPFQDRLGLSTDPEGAMVAEIYLRARWDRVTWDAKLQGFL